MASTSTARISASSPLTSVSPPRLRPVSRLPSSPSWATPSPWSAPFPWWAPLPWWAPFPCSTPFPREDATLLITSPPCASCRVHAPCRPTPGRRPRAPCEARRGATAHQRAPPRAGPRRTALAAGAGRFDTRVGRRRGWVRSSAKRAREDGMSWGRMPPRLRVRSALAFRGRPMKLARKLAVALALGVVAVMGVHAWVALRTEPMLFEADIHKQRKFAKGAAILAQASWRKGGLDRAQLYVRKVNKGLPDLLVRWTWRDLPVGHPDRPRLTDGQMQWLDRGTIVAVRQRTDGAEWRFIYAPMSIPGSRRAALEIGESLEKEVAFVSASR